MEYAVQNPAVGPAVDQGAAARAAGAVGRWSLDARRSTIGFETKKFWGLVTVKGTFAEAHASADVGADGGVSARLDIEAASVNTGQAKRDVHLRGKDFFDTARFPVMQVEITRLDLVAPDRGRVQGRMTILGQTRPLEMDVAIALGAGGDKATVSGEVTIDRGAFGMTWSPLRMASMAVAIKVQLAWSKA